MPSVVEVEALLFSIEPERLKELNSHLVNGMTERIEYAFVSHLSHRWVSVDGMCNVFQYRSHFQCERPFSNQFADVGSNTLDAQDAMIVFSSDHADESPGLFSFLCE